jgi:hypothetical protein
MNDPCKIAISNSAVIRASRVAFGVFFTLTLACLCPVPSRGQAAASGSLFHEEVIGEVSPGAEVKHTAVGDHHLAWAEKQGGKYIVRLDGKQQGDSYDAVDFLAFSRDESHLTFSGKRGSEWIVVMDGQPRANGYTYTTSVTFQPQGSAMAYGACRGKKCHLVVDGTETGAEYEEISYARYSRDGKRIAYLAKRSKKWVAVVDGKELGPEFEQVWFSNWGFTRSGGRFLVTGRNGSKWFHEVDGIPTPAFDALSRIVMSRDEQHYAYCGADSKGGMKKQKVLGTVVKDGQVVASYEGQGMVGNWSIFAGSHEYMVGGVRELTTDFHGVSSAQFDPEGKLVYAARRDRGDVAVFHGGEAGAGFDEILSPVIFTPDSAHFAYVARLHGDFVEVRDNKVVRTLEGGKRGATDVAWIALSPDAAHLAYETVSGGQQYKAAQTPRAYRSVVIDGQSGREYNAIAIRNFGFDADGHHSFYEVIGADGDRDLLNIDGHDSRLYDSVANPEIAADGKSITFVARDGSRFLRVSYTLAGGSGAETAQR